MMKQDRSTWSGLVLVELLEKRALIGRMGPRHRNIQEAEGRRVYIIFLFLILIES